MEENIINKRLQKEAKKFKMNWEDLDNLYDIFYMINWQDYKNIKLNKMDKWFNSFFIKLEKAVVPELYKKGKK